MLEAASGRNGHLGVELMKEDFDTMTHTLTREELLQMRDKFHDWCCESQYITGSWSSGEYIDEDRHSPYAEFLRMNAWEQLMHILEGGKT